MIILRPDQAALKQGIYNSWSSGKRNVLMVQPTGGGKSVVMSDITLDKYQLGAHQVVMAHRKELVGQLSGHVARRGIPHRIIGSHKTVALITAQHRREFGRSFVNPSAPCTVASVDTLISRAKELKEWGKQIDFWKVDEAHHLLRENKWGRAIELFPNGLGLGASASPQRADGQGLGRHADGVFDDMIIGPSSRELMDLGAITDYEYVVPASDFEIGDDAITDSGDFSPKKMREASKKSHITGDVVQEYCKLAFGKRAIVFATDVETANEIAAKFKAIGIPAASVSAETPEETRDEFVRRFREGSIWVLINVDLFGEGFDVPAVEVVFLCRPTASLAVFLQQCGRALRTLLGKLYGLIVDMVSNYKRHGLPDKHRYWTLDRREKRGKQERDPEEIELTACRNCSRPYLRCLPVCPQCGHAPVITPICRSLEQIDGDLILLDRSKLAEMRAAAELENPADMKQRIYEQTHGNAAAAAGGFARQQERIAAQQTLDDCVARWAGWQRGLGRSDSESYRRFYLTLGVDVLTARSLPRADMEKLTMTVQGWMT